MTVGYALAIKRLYGAGIVRVAAKHNLREIAAELGADGHIDAARIADNFTLRGPATADGVAQLAKSLMESAGVTKCRKTAVMALELLFTLPAAAAIDPRQYFEQATTWAEQHFSVPVLSCVVHLDEGAPHAHVLLLPLVDGRMGGSDLHGGKAKLWAMQTDFHTCVGAHYGFARQTPTKRHTKAARAAGMAMLRDCFQTNTAMSDAAIDVLLKPHAKDPEPLLVALGFVMPAAKTHAKGSFVAMMTAPCKPEPRNPIGNARNNPIGKAVPDAAPESQPYTCVGIAFPTAPIPTVEHHVDTTETPATDSATGQQASSRSAAGPSTTGQQRARSTADGLLSFQDTPLVVTTNPVDPTASAMAPRKNATKPRRAASTLASENTAASVPAVAQVDQQDGKPALQQAGHRQDAQDRARADEQAGQHTSCDVGPAATEPTERATAKRQAKTESAGPAKLASTTATKRGRTAAKRSTGVTSTTSTPTAGKRQAASSEHLTPCNATASHATPSKRGKTATAALTSAPAAPRASKRTPGTCAPSRVSGSGSGAKTAAPGPLSTSQAAAAATPTTRRRTTKSKVRKSDFEPSVESAAVSSIPEPGISRFDIGTDQPDEIRRLADGAHAKTQRGRSTSSAAPVSANTGESGNDRAGYSYAERPNTQPAAASSSSATAPPTGDGSLNPELIAPPRTAVHSAENLAQHSQADENGRHDATAPAHRPALAPSTNGSATAPQMTPAHDTEPSPQCVMPEPARAAAQAPPIGGPLDGAGMLALEGDLQQHEEADSYQRHRDDDHPAEHWDADLGEFVTAPATPAMRTTARASRPDADDLGLWHEARPAVLEVAMASIREAWGLSAA